MQGHEYTYVPGHTLEIPVEGGGTLVFKGQVFQQQPKLAWGYPLEPAADQMILTHFVLLRDGQALLHAPSGASSMVEKKDKLGIILYVPGYGLFTFALQPFEGAVKGEASWTQAKFTINGHQFYLLSGTPITGGDQPHDIWVSLNPDFPSGVLHGVALSARPLQNQGNAAGQMR